MQKQRFGIEIEMTGLTRNQAARIVAEYFNSSVHYDGGYYDVYSVTDPTNRKWKVMFDSSISARNRHGWNVSDDFIERMNRTKPKTLSKVKDIWYNGNTTRSQRHYDDSRYHGLNFHSVFYNGTVEFRLFNGTLHAGKIKAYIQFCLAISNQALTQQKASRRKTFTSNEKYTFRTWLLRLGMIGDEFKTARKHLLDNLDGSIAWKDPNQAVEQRRRLAERALQEANQQNDISEQTEEIEEQDMGMTMNM